MRRSIRFMISMISIASLVAVCLGYFGHAIYALDALAHFRLHFLLLSLPLALLAMMLRDWIVVWRIIGTAVLAVAGLGVLWETPLREGGDVEVSVMTANLYQQNVRTEDMKRALLDADADVLVTMETTKAVVTGANSLALSYPYRLSLSTTGQTLRTVIWSKFPMRDGQLLLEDLIEPTGALAIVEVSPDVEFTILGLHLAHNIVGNQKRQIEAMNLIAESMPMPRVIVGDFNATAWSYALRRIEELTATQRIGGFRVTWRGFYPTRIGSLRVPLGLQIDHILVSDGVGVRKLETRLIPGSDHNAVLARISLPGA